MNNNSFRFSQKLEAMNKMTLRLIRIPPKNILDFSK